jgi:hypothetical protein
MVCLLCLFGMIPLTGCSPGIGKLVPVQGKVELDGIPLGGGQVFYAPEVRKPGPRVESIANIQSDGTYTMLSNGKRGVPPGKYKVTIIPPPGEPGAALNIPARYGSDAETPFAIEVTASTPPGQYDLKMTR